MLALNCEELPLKAQLAAKAAQGQAIFQHFEVTAPGDRLGSGGDGTHACVPGCTEPPNLGFGGTGTLLAFVAGESFIWTSSRFCAGDAALAADAMMAAASDTARNCFRGIFFIEYLRGG